MKVEMWERFATKLEAPNDAPEPHRSAFFNILRADDKIQLLIFGPASKTLQVVSPATLLAITDKGWILVSGTDTEPASSVRCGFNETLLIELTVVLLFGGLRIDFLAEGGARHVAITFNTVMFDYYQTAVGLLLKGVEGTANKVQSIAPSAAPDTDSLTLSLQNAVSIYKPSEQRIIDIAHWLSVFSGWTRWFQHEISPEAILVLTERELICISEATTGGALQTGSVAKYGNIITYFPLARLAGHHMQADGRLMKLVLDIDTSRGGKTVAVEFPLEQEDKVESFMKQVRQQQSALHLPVKPA